MKNTIALLLLAMYAASAAAQAALAPRTDTLEAWSPLVFPRIERRSSYSIEVVDGVSALRLESDNASSGLRWKEKFDPYAHRKLSFTWRISAIIPGIDPLTKRGDDYPVRVFVLFAYDPKAPGSAPRLVYGMAKALYGEYPPYASLNFVWGNAESGPAVYRNPYTDRSVMIPLDRGGLHALSWRTHTVDIVAAYRDAFAEDPPAEATLAVMADSDNSGASTLAWIRSISLAP